MIKTDVKTGLEQGKILGVGLNSTQMAKVLAQVRSNLSGFIQNRHKPKPYKYKYKPFYIVTPNPEIVIYACKDMELKNILNSADFSIPDGIGLAQAKAFLSLKAPKNRFLRCFALVFQGIWVGLATIIKKDWLKSHLNPIKGRDLFLELIKLSNKRKWKVFFLGGEGDEASEASQKLTRSYKSVKIKSFAGPIVNTDGAPSKESEKKIEKEAIDRINKFKPHLLFVAFGAPEQEKWIYRNLKQLKIGGAMAVGGTFRYFAGKSILPPSFMEKAGLEWIWRLITEPKRIKRILTAFPIFPIRVFWYKLINL